MPQEMQIRFALYESEDERLIQYLEKFRGIDRNRRVRALMRAGLNVMQDGMVIKTEPQAPEPVLPLSQQDENVDYVKGLGLDPFGFCFGAEPGVPS